MQAAQDRQKSYADRKRKPMEFEVRDRVMLKVSPWKGVVRFGKRGKLNPRYVKLFRVLAKVGKVAYKLELPQELSRVHHTFHVSNMKKCYTDEPLVMPLEGIHIDDTLQFVEEPVKIMEREIKRLKGLFAQVNKARGAMIHWESITGESTNKIWGLTTFWGQIFGGVTVMKGLHNAFEEAAGNGLITGVNINNSTINVSHLFYADDVIITTDWNARDMDNIIHEVLSMASNAGCITGDILFNYLGLPIGSNMKYIASWKTLVDRFHMRLSSWKGNLLSIRGRLTLIKSVLGSLGIYYLSIFRAPESVLQDLERIRAKNFWGGNKDENKMAWVKWPIILNFFDKGGLNIGSLKAFNLALLQKWRWRLLS
ncbi:hypothetical protein Tco_0411234, partial [Tanacetum coccineum]